MDTIFFLILRRMRAPLLVLVFTYAIAMLGLVLIPGVDAEGNVWHMDFFHAFYFVSFMASTIGFGEIPYAFSDGQRLWVTLSIYSTVVAWIYSIGTVLTLIQDPAFRQAVTERHFTRMVRALRDPFYLVCGYGDTGSVLVKALTDSNQRAVVVEIDPERVSLLNMQNLRQYVPVLQGDAGRPVHLLEAGLKHPLCAGVVALTNINEVNLKIAITAKLLHPDISVICRADSHDVEANMASFGTDYIIDPFDTFAGHLATALHSPDLYLLREWLMGADWRQAQEPVRPPRQGFWLVCGYGRFGKAICQCLQAQGIETIVIESAPEKSGTPPGVWVKGRGTEAVTLLEGRIKQAVGLVAGTDDDANNLSIIMTARELNPELFVVLRQNLKDNQSIVHAVQADMLMHPSAIIANRIRMLLATPLLYAFIRIAQKQPGDWASDLLGRLAGLVGERGRLEVWEVELTPANAQALCALLRESRALTLEQLQQDPRQRDRTLPCVALLLKRAKEKVLLPADGAALEENDRLLFCGRADARSAMEWTLQNAYALDYIVTGETRPQGWLWRLLTDFMGKRRVADRG